MKPSALAVIALALGVPLAGCNDAMTREQTGRMIGAVAGGMLGSKIGKGSGRTAATIAGTMLGAYLGGQLARHMDDYDRDQADHALEYNRDDQSASWHNPNTGYRYDLTPRRSYYADDHTPCREYSSKAWIDGREEVVYGTACRQADGSWQARN